MVMGRVRVLFFAAILTVLVGVGAVVPASAQSILDQMQTEIAAIVSRNRPGVVCIEDAPARMSMNAEYAAKLFNDPAVKAAILAARRALQEARQQIARERSTTNEKSQKAVAEAMERAERSLGDNPENADSSLEEARQTLRQLKQESAKENGAISPAEIERAVEILQTNQSAIRRAIRVDAAKPQIYRLAPKSGTGFSIGGGFILTTADVADGMKKPQVITDSGVRLRAELMGIDRELNVALLKLTDSGEIAPLKLGDSDTVQAGNFAITIGNQSGQPNFASLALVGGIRNNGTFNGSRFYPTLFQIAGTVGAGTSGAPLFNTRGEVIAMLAAVPANSWVRETSMTTPAVPFMSQPLEVDWRQGEAGTTKVKSHKSSDPEKAPEKSHNVVGPIVATTVGYSHGFRMRTSGQPDFSRLSQSDASDDAPDQAAPAKENGNFFIATVTNTGFAIPINDIKAILDDLRSGKAIVRGWLGLSLDETSSNGMKVEGVYPDSPAFHSTIQPGDVLLSLNGKPTLNLNALRAVLMRIRPGETVVAVISRDGRQDKTDLKIEPRPTASKIKQPIITPIDRSKMP